MKNSLRVQRAIKEISQEVLAQEVGCSRQTINAMEKNKYAPSVILALKIARYFGCPLEEVFMLTEEDFPPGKESDKTE